MRLRLVGCRTEDSEPQRHNRRLRLTLRALEVVKPLLER
jgi:hypothetical protein